MPLSLCRFLCKLYPLLLRGRNGETFSLKKRFTQGPLWINGWCVPPGPEEGLISHRNSRESTHGEEENGKDSSLSFIALLKACTKKKDLREGTRLHKHICKSGFLDGNLHLGNTLINMYAKCGALDKAQQLLHELPVRDVISWNVLIASYVQNGQGEQALNCYEQMQSEGLFPNGVTYSCILKACGIIHNLDLGQQIHDEIVSQGLLRGDIVLGIALIDMYVKCGVLSKAKATLEVLPSRDVVSWNALIAGYAQQDQAEEAWDCFKQMQYEGLSPTAITYNCILKVCAITSAIEQGKRVHDKIVEQGLLKNNVVLGTALVDMYAKCGVLAKAKEVLNELCVRDAIMWNALIAGYIQQGECKEALLCFHKMQSDGLTPDTRTYACILKVCGITSDLYRGKQIHEEIINQGFSGTNAVLGTALVDMYAKCGELEKATQVLDELPIRDVISWNALIAGYAQQGQGKEAIKCMERMQNEGFTPNIASWNAVIGGYAQQGLTKEALDCFRRVQCEGIFPDAITFVCVLNACCHAGLLDEGQMIFENMMKSYGITPNIEHYTCMIDLLGRTGYFDKAVTMIEKMPSSNDPLAWSVLLDACEKWGNVKLGRWAFEHAIHLDECDPAFYVCMEKIYVAAGMQENAQKIAAMRVRDSL